MAQKSFERAVRTALKSLLVLLFVALAAMAVLLVARYRSGPAEVVAVGPTTSTRQPEAHTGPSLLEPPLETAADRSIQGTPSKPGVVAGSNDGSIAAEPPIQVSDSVIEALESQAKTAGWDVKYANLPADRLLDLRRKIDKEIFDLAAEEFEQRFQRGEYEILNQGPAYHGQAYDPMSVYTVRIPPGGPVMLITLPESEFQDLYKLKAESAWLLLKASGPWHLPSKAN